MYNKSIDSNIIGSALYCISIGICFGYVLAAINYKEEAVNAAEAAETSGSIEPMVLDETTQKYERILTGEQKNNMFTALINYMQNNRDFILGSEYSSIAELSWFASFEFARSLPTDLSFSAG